MCKSNAYGGKRCDKENSKRKTITEQKIQNKVLESMDQADQDSLNSVMENYEKFLAMRQTMDSDAIPVTEAYEEDAERELYRNHEWNTAVDKYHDGASSYESYNDAIQGMEHYPGRSDKARYLEETNPEFRKLSEKIDELEEKRYSRSLTESDQAKLDSYVLKKNEMVSQTDKLSSEEVNKMVKANPYTAKFKKAESAYKEVDTRLRNHYRREAVLNDNPIYKEAYTKFAKTKEGKKLVQELAEVETHESISNKALSGGQIKATVFRKRGYEASAVNAEKNLAVRNQVANAYDYNNKYTHINQQIIKGNKDVDKNMELRMGANDDPIIVQTNEQFTKTMERADASYGSKYENETPEVRRAKVANELFSRKKVTSVREISNNPQLKEFFDTADAKHRDFRKKVVDRQARKIANKYDVDED